MRTRPPRCSDHRPTSEGPVALRERSQGVLHFGLATLRTPCEATERQMKLAKRNIFDEELFEEDGHNGNSEHD